MSHTQLADQAFDAVPKYKIKPAPGGAKPSIYAVRWSYDGSLLASAIDDGRIRLYDGATGRTKFSLLHNDGEDGVCSDESHHPQHRKSHISKAPLGSDAMAAAAAAHAAAAEAMQNKGINHATIALRWSPLIVPAGDASSGSLRNYMLLSSSSNGVLRQWKITQNDRSVSGECPQPSCAREVQLGNNSVAFCLDYDSSGKRFAAGCKDAVLRVYDEETGALVNTLDGGVGAEFTAHTVAREMPSADYALKLINKTQADETVRGLNRESREVTRHSNRLYGCKFASGHTSHIDNLVISAGWDRTMQVWDLRAPGPAVKSFFGVYLSGDALDCVGSDIVTASYRPVNQLQLWDLRFGNEPRDIDEFNDGKPHEFFSAQFSSNRDVNSHFDTTSSTEGRSCFLAAGGTGSDSLKILDHLRGNKVAAVINDLPGGVVSLDFCPHIFQPPAEAQAQVDKSTLDTTPSPGHSRYAHLKETHVPGEKARSGAHNSGTRIAIACKDSHIRVVDICAVRSVGFAYEDEEEVDDGEEDQDNVIVGGPPSPVKAKAAPPLSIVTDGQTVSAAQTLSPCMSDGSITTGFSPAAVKLPAGSEPAGGLKHSASSVL